MPRTTYSDFSLPNLEQDFDIEKRTLTRKKNQVSKRKSKNIARPNRKKYRSSKVSHTKMRQYKAAFSPVHKVEPYEDDSASFQSDCIDNRLLEEHPTFDRNEESLPFLDKDCELAVNRLVEQCEHRELVTIM